MSGGVDSSVAALLLKDEGHDVTGVMMRRWREGRYAGGGRDACFGAGEADSVRAAEAFCRRFGLPFRTFDCAEAFEQEVVANFRAEYLAGRTPNPCVRCNALLKFGLLPELARASGLACGAFATGHYARVRQNEHTGLFELLKGLDANKDQSYFLHRLNQAQLSKAMFPIGHLCKTEVRRIATEIGLPNAKKKDSTGICFIGERPFRDFLNRYISKEPGPIVDDRGRKLGQHVGLSFYTLGQRSGLGIGGVKEKGAARGAGEHAPWFVARKDVPRNTLVVVQGHDHPWLLSHHVQADQASWVAGTPPAPGCYGSKTRYRQPDACTQLVQTSATAFALDCTAQPQWAVTPGQSAVLYDGEVCLGGGIITAMDTVDTMGTLA